MKATHADLEYLDLLGTVVRRGAELETRNHKVKRLIGTRLYIEDFPLITLRKTAWKKALREMEWFMSGDLECPTELTDWWKGQLSPNGMLVDGYSWQLRASPSTDDIFDQVKFILSALKTSPNSRRLVMTTWNPGDMASITESNNNPNTPTCCHGSMVQFFVTDGTLHMFHYQRSADLLLGLPHNLVQYWALLTYFAHHSRLKVGTIQYTIGDAHIYQDESHLQAISEMEDAPWDGFRFDAEDPKLTLEYNYSGQLDDFGTPAFLASDFSVAGEIPKPVSTTRPKLF